MNSREMLEKAVINVGVSELSRQLGWGKGAIDAAKKGDRPVPPFRASQIASILGLDPKTAYIEALKEKTVPEAERRLLGELLKVCKASAAALTIAVALTVATLAPAKVDAAQVRAESAENIHYDQWLRQARFWWAIIRACLSMTITGGSGAGSRKSRDFGSLRAACGCGLREAWA